MSPESVSVIDRLSDPSDRVVDFTALADEISRLTEIENADGLRKLVKAYELGEIQADPRRTHKETRRIVGSNIDYLAFHIDISKGDISRTWGLTSPATLYDNGNVPLGKVQSFYRQVTGYSPTTARKQR